MDKKHKIVFTSALAIVTIVAIIFAVIAFRNKSPVKTEKQILEDSASFYRDLKLEKKEEGRIYEEREKRSRERIKNIEDSINSNSPWIQLKKDRNRAVIDSANAEAVRNGTRR